jgi:nucleoside-diphosphate-sugar epimerase
VERRHNRVLVTGGAGYVGSSLVPKLLGAGYETVVLDLYLYGDVFAGLQSERLIEVKGDLRNPPTWRARFGLRRRDPSRLHLERSLVRSRSGARPLDQL